MIKSFFFASFSLGSWRFQIDSSSSKGDEAFNKFAPGKISFRDVFFSYPSRTDVQVILLDLDNSKCTKEQYLVWDDRL